MNAGVFGIFNKFQNTGVKNSAKFVGGLNVFNSTNKTAVIKKDDDKYVNECNGECCEDDCDDDCCDLDNPVNSSTILKTTNLMMSAYFVCMLLL